MSPCLLVDPDAQVQDVLQCGGITMPHEETNIDQVTMSQAAGEDWAYIYIYMYVVICKTIWSCIDDDYEIMYHHVSDCIIWAITMSSHARTVLIWHTSCSSRPGQLSLGCWSAPVSFHSACHPLRFSLSLCAICLCMWFLCLRAKSKLSKLHLNHD